MLKALNGFLEGDWVIVTIGPFKGKRGTVENAGRDICGVRLRDMTGLIVFKTSSLKIYTYDESEV
jgi:hypothetical protein